jgi:hypothetical protein
MNKKITLVTLLLLTLGLLLTGCSQDTTIDVQYSSELSVDNIGEGESLTVAEFMDKTDQTGIGGAKNPIGNVAMTYRSTTPLGKLVRDTLSEELSKRGFEVDKMGLWDLNEENVKDLKDDFVMGGEIKAFWAENRPNTQIGGRGFSEVKLYIVVVDPETGEQVWIGQIEGGVTRSKLLGTPELDEMINVAFSQAIDKLLTSSDFKKAISEY